MRLFAAIDIEPTVIERIEQIQKRLRQDLNLSEREVKWVRPDQIHLTLKFLGDIRDEVISEVCDVVTRTAANAVGFDLKVRGIGTFGRPARVVWAGTEPCPELIKLQSELEGEFATIGFAKDNRPFAGHLTLCRVKSTKAGRKLTEAVEPYKDEFFGPVAVDQLILYESRLSSAGPEYTAVCTAALK